MRGSELHHAEDEQQDVNDAPDREGDPGRDKEVRVGIGELPRGFSVERKGVCQVVHDYHGCEEKDVEILHGLRFGNGNQGWNELL